MRILVTGKNGQLGKSINSIVNQNSQDNEFIFIGQKDLDFSKKNGITNYFENNYFDIFINCAAFTDVDKAEEERVLADKINHVAVEELAKVVIKQNAKLIHISTDYVFDGEGTKLYKETDITNPINVYGKTKLAGEQVVQKIMKTNAIILRTSWLYSKYGNNFVITMLRLGKELDELSIVNDQIGSPTCADDLARLILEIIVNKKFFKKNQTTQIYHFSNIGECSWYEFANEIFKLANIKCKTIPISSYQYQKPARRPKMSLMSKNKITKISGFKNNDWKTSLSNYFK